MTGAKLSARDLSKSFGSRSIFRGLDAECYGSEVKGIVGANGSGKSTLLQILTGSMHADAGEIELTVDESIVESDQRAFTAGVVAPYLNIYKEFTPRELLQMQRRLRGHSSLNDAKDLSVLQRVGLGDRADDLVRTFSSGLRQRTILALAVCPEPVMLMLDEPTTTLDSIGKEIVEQEIELQRSRGGITFIATNDERERALCDEVIDLAVFQ